MSVQPPIEPNQPQDTLPDATQADTAVTDTNAEVAFGSGGTPEDATQADAALVDQNPLV